MKPQYVAIALAAVGIVSMSYAPAHADVVDSMTGKWKATGSATIFEVFPDGRYKSTINGVTVETGKINATNGTWSIRADSGRVDNGSFTINGNDLQLKGMLVTTAWNRDSAPIGTSTSAAATAAAISAGAANSGSASTPGTASSGSTTTPGTPGATATPHLSDKQKAIQRFNAKYGARAGGWVKSPPNGHMNDRQARKFWKGF